MTQPVIWISRKDFEELSTSFSVDVFHSPSPSGTDVPLYAEPPVSSEDPLLERAKQSDDFFNWTDIDNYDHIEDAARAYKLRHVSCEWTVEELVSDYKARV